MRTPAFALVFAALVLNVARAAQTPEDAWRQAITQENTDYGQGPHAMLKIQDSAYLAEGQSAELLGRIGEPDSWHWSRTSEAPGTLSISVKDGRLAILSRGEPVDPGQIARSVPVDEDVDVTGQPTQVAAGVTGWRLFVFNQQHPAAKGFTGVAYFPYDPAFRVTAQFRPDPTLPPRVFRTSRGTDKQFYHAGDAVFALAGKPITLPFYTGGNDPEQIKDISAFFTDALTGGGAYGAGRYLDVVGFAEFPPTTVTIDFNFAYNPNCARSSHFTCPIAVDSIDLPVIAGERDPHAAD
jgi:uncharacterized protein (DUF1684 family)